jgi:peptidoglycan/xylan/chitin deacetylase (PgdA/CDA1 family)
MYEYGARSGYWRLLSIFDELDVKCTFYACGVAMERNRKASAEMRGRGHDVMSHGWRWEDVALLTREQERDHIKRAIKSIEETTGERPWGWYCRGRPSVNTRELVVEEGNFLYDSDAYNDDLPYWTMATYPKMMNIGLHMRAIGHPARAKALYDFIKYAKSLPNVWFARRIEIAKHWMAHHADDLPVDFPS